MDKWTKRVIEQMVSDHKKQKNFIKNHKTLFTLRNNFQKKIFISFIAEPSNRQTKYLLKRCLYLEEEWAQEKNNLFILIRGERNHISLIIYLFSL